MKTKKLLSLLLALMMMLSVVPMYASAAEPIQLVWYEHMIEYPIVSGDAFYFGQPVGNQILTGGKVVYNGVEVPGSFELLYSSDYVPTEWGPSGPYAPFKFIPDDTSAFIGFQLNDLLCYSTCLKTTPTITTPPSVVGTADSGTRLGKLTVNNPTLINPYTNKEIDNVAFVWGNRRTQITASGWHDGTISAAGYEDLSVKVYVRLTGDSEETKIGTVISEYPTIVEPIYYGDDWSTIALLGGKAVDDVNGIEVQGTFKIGETGKITSSGTRTINITFIPNDETYGMSSGTLNITVEKAPIKFLDENGADVIPEYTIPCGYDLDNYSAPIFEECKKYLNTGDEIIRLSFSEEDSKTKFDAGTYELTVRATPYYTTSNYLRNDNLKVKITVEPGTLNPTIKSSTEGYYVQDSSSTYNVKGTFDVYVNDELIASDVAYNSGKVKWEATENGTYTMKWVYNPVENDNFIIDDVTTTMNVIFPNTITYTGMSAYILGSNGKRSELFETTERRQGTPVTIGCDLPAFATWIITDTNGNTVDLGIEDLTATEITFTMPAYDIVITTKTALDLAAEDCDHLCHSDNPIYQMFWKVMSFIFRLFDVQQYCDCGNLHYDKAIFG